MMSGRVMIQPPFSSEDERKERRGQSLVEFALVLPILLLIVAGILEASNLITAYNRVQLAAREGARFGAAGGVDAGISQVVQQSIMQSLPADPSIMSIWVIRPIVQVQSTSPLTFRWNNDDPITRPWGTDPSGAVVQQVCLYGDICGTGLLSGLSRTQVLNDLAQINVSGASGIAGTRFVIVVVNYNASTLLNLPFFRIPGESGGRVPLQAYSVMRQEVEQQTISQLQSGCSAYPIALYYNRRSDAPGNHKPEEASENEMFTNVPQAADGFQFVAWRAAPPTPYDDFSYLDEALTYPGNSLNPTSGFREYMDESDTQMHRGDWLLRVANLGSGGWSNVVTQLNRHRDTNTSLAGLQPRSLRIIVFDTMEMRGGVNMYHIYGFAVVRILDFNTTNVSTMTFQFVRWDTTCGFDLGG